MSKRVVIVGGHGNIALRLARFLAPSHSITSIVRNSEHEGDVEAASATPIVLSLEDSPTSGFSLVFDRADVVYFVASAGENAGDERLRKVDYEGAVKVFDAIEGVKGPKPRLVLISSVDVRDPDKFPAHYHKLDIKVSKQIRAQLGTYFHWKYQAEKNLVERDTFKWTIVRPGGFNEEPGTGKASIGKTHITEMISRDDITKTLALLVDREDAAGLAIEVVGGDTVIEEGLDAAIKKGETAFLG